MWKYLKLWFSEWQARRHLEKYLAENGKWPTPPPDPLPYQGPRPRIGPRQNADVAEAVARSLFGVLDPKKVVRRIVTTVVYEDNSEQVLQEVRAGCVFVDKAGDEMVITIQRIMESK